MCGISNADPVIISRAKALLIVTTYQRIKCSCGWSLHEEKLNPAGWITPPDSVKKAIKQNISEPQEILEQSIEKSPDRISR